MIDDAGLDSRGKVRRSLVLSAVCLGLGITANAAALRRLDDYSGKAGDLWQAAGLRPLSLGTSGSEVRVWADSSLIDIWTGWVVTPTRVRVFSNEIVVDGATRSGDSLRQISSQRRNDARAILGRFTAFVSLDGQSVSCPVLDGVGYYIEVRHEGAYAAFYAGNPGQCDEPHTEQVAEALELLWDLHHDPQ
jgi:hypothetical protein